MTILCHFRALMAAVVLMLAGGQAHAAQCATPAKDGSASLSGIVNTYWPGTANVSASATSISLGAARGAAATIAAGDLVLIIQMQDAQFNSNNTAAYGDGAAGEPDNGLTSINQTGRFAFARATNTVGAGGGSLSIAASTGIAFNNAAASSSRGQRRFQVIRVPQYHNATITGPITAPAWNGTTGGVVALDVAGALTFAGGSVNVDGLGFRGGAGRNLTGGAGANTDQRTLATNNANGSKGEGVAGTPRYVVNDGALLDTGVEGYPNGSYARGAPGNAGGGGTDGNPANNDQNSGGGGGAGVGPGGRGGHAWCSSAPTGCAQSGGWGGAGVAGLGADRIILGGGGGAGTGNNNANLLMSGAAGGGIILIRSRTIAGAGVLSADGAAASQAVIQDASGGGGGGGSILLIAESAADAALTVRARGGLGGSNIFPSEHGPGGGGGGGLVVSNLALSADVSGGAAGTTSAGGGPFGPAYGAAGGAGGVSGAAAPSAIPGLSSGAECTPRVTKTFSPAVTGANTPARMTITVSNPNPTLGMAALAFTDTYPSGLVNATPPAASNGCGGTLNAVAGGGSASLGGGTLGSGLSCSIGIDVRSATSGAYENRLAPGAVAATISARSVASIDAAADTLSITAPLIAIKTVGIVSDPVNGAALPKAIPGAVVEYEISFSNPSGVVIDANSVVVADAIPTHTVFLNADLGAPGSGPVAFIDGSPASGLSLMPGGVSFSNDGGSSFTYAPAPGADPGVTDLRISLSGPMAPGASGALRFRVVIE